MRDSIDWFAVSMALVGVVGVVTLVTMAVALIWLVDVLADIVLALHGVS